MANLIQIEHILSDEPLYVFETKLTSRQWWDMLQNVNPEDQLYSFDNGKFVVGADVMSNLMFYYIDESSNIEGSQE